jgi:DNA-binding response OmpR family regulator
VDDLAQDPDVAIPAAGTRDARPTVLVVDDEPSTQRMLDRLLSFHGFAPLQATTLPEAVAIADREPIDAFVVGLMPGASGLTIVGWLRQHRAYARVPVFVLTSHVEVAEDAGTLIRQLGARLFFKGQSLELLIDRLQRLLCEPIAVELENELVLP